MPMDEETLALLAPGERPVWLAIEFDDPALQAIRDANSRMGAPEGPASAR